MQSLVGFMSQIFEACMVFITHIVQLTCVSMFHFLYKFSVLLSCLPVPSTFYAKRSSFVAACENVAQANVLQPMTCGSFPTLISWRQSATSQRKVKRIFTPWPNLLTLFHSMLQFSVTSVLISINSKIQRLFGLLYQSGNLKKWCQNDIIHATQTFPYECIQVPSVY